MTMRRRDFLGLLGVAAAVGPLAARAQQSMSVIGFLGTGSAAPYQRYTASFADGLKAMGHIVGRNVAIEYRWAEGRYDHMPGLAAELLDRRVSVIVAAGGNAPAETAKAASSTIPIVFISGGDPVRGGLVTHLNRPEGNITGVTMSFSAVVAKRLELLHKIAKSPEVAALVNPNYPEADVQRRQVGDAARAMGVKVHLMDAGTAVDIDNAFAALVRHGARALFVANDPYFNSQRNRFIALAARHAVPAIYDTREFPEAGGLMSYGSSIVDAFHQAGVYTGKILKGAHPSDLPVLQASKFELVINLKTARALGLDIPPTLLALADQVVE
jgi:putative ABC transport system substrate-binding protein